MDGPLPQKEFATQSTNELTSFNQDLGDWEPENYANTNCSSSKRSSFPLALSISLMAAELGWPLCLDLRACFRSDVVSDFGRDWSSRGPFAGGKILSSTRFTAIMKNWPAVWETTLPSKDIVARFERLYTSTKDSAGTARQSAIGPRLWLKKVRRTHSASCHGLAAYPPMGRQVAFF